MELKKTLVIVSGYFNPIHSGHIEYFVNSKEKGDLLLAIINNDLQRKLKGSSEFMNETEREFIVSKIKPVDFTFISIDNDKTVAKSIEFLNKKYRDKYKLIFANGGDQNTRNSPERKICDSLGITSLDNMGEKIQSSSWLLNKLK